MTPALREATCGDCGRSTGVDVAGLQAQRSVESLVRMALCEACGAARAAERAAALECARARRAQLGAEQRVQTSGVPRALLGLDWSALEVDSGNELAIAAGRAWGSGAGHGVALTGDVGVGKTTIAAAAANACLARGQRLRWVFVPNLFTRLSDRRDRFRTFSDEIVAGRGPLVLDDLDKARPTEYAAEVLLAAIDSRITDDSPLFVTMNLNYAELATAFPGNRGDAIASRLVAYCGAAIEVSGPDRRLPSRVAALPGMEAAAA